MMKGNEESTEHGYSMAAKLRICRRLISPRAHLFTVAIGQCLQTIRRQSCQSAQSVAEKEAPVRVREGHCIFLTAH